MLWMSRQKCKAEYLVPNIGMAVWLLYIISQVYKAQSDAKHIHVLTPHFPEIKVQTSYMKNL